ncbi:DUF465 domain-containing protein [Sphingomonas ginkgonis]|uniref:DUF465 domain-containing protein n=1 Tax=Sphingomonas ginkgonis TaxID=2315330 RepID=A0A429VA66_9SPHN|nr:DUF465 domain-containing protein [Sphingomonas ginkgonis]RST30816.1 DUF465 domain-containing protein [Sphingomonas ginkgonis]
MNDDDPSAKIGELRAEHAFLDERLRAVQADPEGDMLEAARLKKRKLLLKDRISLLLDRSIPDIIA